MRTVGPPRVLATGGPGLTGRRVDIHVAALTGVLPPAEEAAE